MGYCSLTHRPGQVIGSRSLFIYKTTLSKFRQVIMQNLKNRWHLEAGYREVLVVAIPLILSTASWSVQHFVDRMFLAWYSPETIAAAMPAGMVHFSMVSIFMGTAGYVSTFVAQYYGAKRYHRIGPALWQGIYMSLIGGVLILTVLLRIAPAIDQIASLA